MIETRLEGDPESVRAAAAWLRTVSRSADAVAVHVTRARAIAADHWDGAAADGYRLLTAPVVTAADEHAASADRAAKTFDLYADRLQQAQDRLAGIRSRARAGGLHLVDTRIAPPSPVPAHLAGPLAPGSADDLLRADLAQRVLLYEKLYGEALQVTDALRDWADATFHKLLDEAADTDALPKALRLLGEVPPSIVTGLSFGLTRVALDRTAAAFDDARREYKRRTRVSGNPATRARLGTPSGAKHVDDLLQNAGTLRKASKVLGPAGLVVDVGLGVKEGHETGKWTRAALKTGAGIGGAALAVATAPVTASAITVVVAAVTASALATAAVEGVYDNWDGIEDWAGNRTDDVKRIVGGTWHGLGALGQLDLSGAIAR